MGEMALYSGQPRSADVVAKTPCRAYRLSAERFARLERDAPTVVIQFQLRGEAPDVAAHLCHRGDPRAPVARPPLT
jgi:CRP-like cAMP-binding protein